MAKFDLPQAACALEWWYYNCHVTSKKNGQRFSVFSSFFRQIAPTTEAEREELLALITDSLPAKSPKDKPEVIEKMRERILELEAALGLVSGGKVPDDVAAYIADGYNDGGTLVLEAGTGVGKSFAYLVPALAWARDA